MLVGFLRELHYEAQTGKLLYLADKTKNTAEMASHFLLRDDVRAESQRIVCTISKIKQELLGQSFRYGQLSYLKTPTHSAATTHRDGAVKKATRAKKTSNAKRLSKSSENSKEGLNTSTNKRNITTVSPLIWNLPC